MKRVLPRDLPVPRKMLGIFRVPEISFLRTNPIDGLKIIRRPLIPGFSPVIKISPKATPHFFPSLCPVAQKGQSPFEQKGKLSLLALQPITAKF